MSDADFSECLIYWYSGTGNSYLIAEKIAQTFSDLGYPTQMVQIREGLIAEIPENVILGFVFPIAVCGTYPFIWEFVESIPLGKNKVFMADTLAGYSGGIKGPLGKTLKKKGYQTIGAIEIIMPENFPPGKTLSKKILARIEPGVAEAERFVRELLEGKTVWEDIPIFSTFLGLICRLKAPWKFLRKIFSFKISHKKCVKCGLCARLCPVGNFNFIEGAFPIILNNCQTCMRCVAYCPSGAVLTKHGHGQSYKIASVEKLLSHKKKI